MTHQELIAYVDARQFMAIATFGEEYLKQAYFKRSPEAQKWEHTEGNVYWKVEPKWVRHTDLNVSPWDISEFRF